ncbi:MAG: hypothetical protein AVDCRST_MAG33-2828 [uncultured Thermomicrobiales bacterium]|uniref:J domain-containing protein n=1 Tax=uncultured Thermomicrobiales bacterium TaxID=1645740 RepID=A0A6J4VCR2_9BACT|nr:MAG: hypothetical protein AVDCRST_MAG33-2828 [uncultured Thermomicrobiales bacterium]
MTPDQTGLRFVPSPDDLAFQRLLVVIEATRQQAATLQATIETLRDELGRFEAAYHARTGHLFVELNRLRLACDEFRHRIALVRGRRGVRQDEIEGDVERLFHDRRQTIDDEAEEATSYRRVYEDEQASRLSEDDDAELRRTYRELARRNHPDLVQDPAERELRERRMVRINTAYRERDLESLRTLLTLSPSSDDSPDASRTPAERLAWATAELSRLDDVVGTLRRDLAIVQETPAHELWLRSKTEPGLLDEMASQVAVQISDAQARLDDLTLHFHALLHEDQ